MLRGIDTSSLQVVNGILLGDIQPFLNGITEEMQPSWMLGKVVIIEEPALTALTALTPLASSLRIEFVQCALNSAFIKCIFNLDDVQ